MADLSLTGLLLLAGDMTDGDDRLLLAGDMTDGDDVLAIQYEKALPDRIERGASRREEWNTQINTRDDGLETRNNRWSSSLRSYEISLPMMERTDADYIALRALFAEAEGSRYSFGFLDWSDNQLVTVRFDSPLRITGHTPELDHIDTFSLIEVREYASE